MRGQRVHRLLRPLQRRLGLARKPLIVVKNQTLEDFSGFARELYPGARILAFREGMTEAQRLAKPPVSHPLFLTLPITGKTVLYANPGYAMRIDQLAQQDSDEVLAFLFEHQLRPEFRFANQWEEHDVLMWDNMGTIHNAVADYLPTEHRYIQRCQVAASRFFDRAGQPRSAALAA
jgi:alpha-ketoglutarate-dependent taurine dioxygenase